VTTCGSNWVPAVRRISAAALSMLRAGACGRFEVMASSAAQAATMRQRRDVNVGQDFAQVLGGGMCHGPEADRVERQHARQERIDGLRRASGAPQDFPPYGFMICDTRSFRCSWTSACRRTWSKRSPVTPT
jgi:hypothetical protein